MTLRTRLQGRDTQFYVELLYGALFIAGFAYLVFRVDPRVAAFEGGLVVGYLLRVWEKMSIYERVLEDVVSREAEVQVAAEVEEQVEEQVADEVASEVEEEVADEVAAELSDLDEQIEEEVAEQVEDAERRDELASND